MAGQPCHQTQWGPAPTGAGPHVTHSRAVRIVPQAMAAGPSAWGRVRVARVSRPARRSPVKQPADMREGETLALRIPVVSEAPWRVRVAVLVAVLVVPAVIGDPTDHRPLDGQATGDRQRYLEPAHRLE
jgi:hypothetical protein